MNYIFIAFILFSFTCAIFCGKVDVVMNEIFATTKKAVEISFSLIGIMAFWLGIMKYSRANPIGTKSKVRPRPTKRFSDIYIDHVLRIIQGYKKLRVEMFA